MTYWSTGFDVAPRRDSLSSRAALATIGAPAGAPLSVGKLVKDLLAKTWVGPYPIDDHLFTHLREVLRRYAQRGAQPPDHLSVQSLAADATKGLRKERRIESCFLQRLAA